MNIFRKAFAERDYLNKLCDEMNQKTAELERIVGELKLGVSARVHGGTDNRWLGFEKMNGAWHFVWAQYHPEDDAEEVMVLQSAPRSIRFQLIPLIPSLISKLTESLDPECVRAKESVDLLNKMIDWLKAQ